MLSAEQLRNSILKLAIQGRLVEQRPEEGTGEELYEEIQAEKKGQIKDEKIKKQKPLKEISEDEIPFDIPESWIWVRLGNISDLLSGTDFSPNEYSDISGKTVYITGASCLSENGVISQRWTDFPRNIANRGDLLIVCKGSGYGKTVICDVEEAHIARQIMAIKKWGNLDIRYVRIFLQSNLYYIKQSGQGVIPGIDRGTILNMVLPLPPLEEQKRIVEKIEELMPYVEQYAAASTKLNTLNTTFPEMMKKSILQEAVQGKLVPQDPNDEPASVLLEKIAEEKKRLIKEGKIKKQKLLPEISEEEIPFEIPESWEWVRIGMITDVKGGKRIPKGMNLTDNPTSHIYIRVTDMKNQTILSDKLKYITDDVYQEIKQYTINKEDLYLTIAGTIGAVGVVPEMFDGMNLTENAVKLCNILIHKKYLLQVIGSPLVQEQFLDKTNKVAQPKLAIARIETTLIPLPPLREQERIVNKIEELMLNTNMLSVQK